MCGDYAIDWSRPMVTKSTLSVTLKKKLVSKLSSRKRAMNRSLTLPGAEFKG